MKKMTRKAILNKADNSFLGVLREILLFGLVGAIGFLVDVLVLYFFSGFIGLFYGRVVSFLAAVFVTWLLNRRLTFSGRSSGLENNQEFFVYLFLMLAGGAVNYIVYVWLVFSYQEVFQYPVIGVAIGSLAGMLINLITSHFFLFKHEVSE